MNTVIATPGLVYLQSQQLVSPYPSPYTVNLPSLVIQSWIWKPVSLERAQSLKVVTDQAVEQVGEIYAALADEDAALAEMGGHLHLQQHARHARHVAAAPGGPPTLQWSVGYGLQVSAVARNARLA